MLERKCIRLHLATVSTLAAVGFYTMQDVTSLANSNSIGLLRNIIRVVVGIAVIVGFIVVFMAMYM